MVKKSKNIIGLLLLLAIPIPSIWALFQKGFFDPHDMHHLADIYEMFRALASGQLPPRLGPDFSFGYTYPLFNYYYLLPFYLGAFFYRVFGSLIWSFKLILIFSLLLSYFGMYKFLRVHFTKLVSLAGAALFVYTPYRAVQMYVRGSLGEMLALSLLPWVLYFVGKHTKLGGTKTIALGSIVFFLLVISHNYFFALSIPIILAYAFVNIKDRSGDLNRVWSIVGMMILGIGLASYWLIPALVEKSLVRSETPFLLADHFPFVKQLIIPSWGYGSSVWGPADEISFQIGLINLVAIVGLIIITVKQYISKKRTNKQFKFNLFVLSGFLVSFIFMNIRTLPLWNLIPFHDLIQFPWRLLNFTTLFSAISIAVVIHEAKPSAQKIVVALSLICMLLVSTVYFKPATYFTKSDHDYLKLFFDTAGYSEDYLLLPFWVDTRPPAKTDVFFESSNVDIVNQQKEGLLKWSGLSESDRVGEITANVYYFPGWQVKVNGENVNINPSGKYGKIKFRVPAGKSNIIVMWNETRLRLAADITTILFFMVIIFIYFKPKVIKFNNRTQENSKHKLAG